MNKSVKFILKFYRYWVGVGCTIFWVGALIMIFLSENGVILIEPNRPFLLFEIGCFMVTALLQFIPIKEAK